MDLNNLTVFSMANRNMQYLSAKQRVVAANIANASTPDYVAQDIEKPDFLKESANDSQASLVMKTTNTKHFPKVVSDIGGNRTGLKVHPAKVRDALTLDGNGVIIEDQMNEASKASSEYKKMITIYNSYKNMLKISNTKISS